LTWITFRDYGGPMKFGLPIVLATTLLAASCGPPAYLVTEPVFSAAAPEIVSAWAALAPAHDARTVTVGAGGLAALSRTLSALPPGAGVLVGVTVPSERRKEFAEGHPQLHLRFVGPPGGQEPSLSVNRSQAWSLVATAAAAPTPGWVVFPADATGDEVQAFSDAWTKARGGALSVNRLPSVVPPPATGVIFDWAGAAADPLLAREVGRRAIHGDPGVPGSSEQPAVHWSLRNLGLGDFLWTVTQKSTKVVEFAPLETVWDGR
jgi:hypothetical protein